MKEFKGTPGPWAWTERSEVSEISSAQSSIPFSIHKEMGNAVAPIANIVNFPPATEAQTNYQRANEKLIAAAPQMLEALQGMIEAWEAVELNPESETILKAKAALSAALD
jgi:hypothetical protein